MFAQIRNAAHSRRRIGQVMRRQERRDRDAVGVALAKNGSEHRVESEVGVSRWRRLLFDQLEVCEITSEILEFSYEVAGPLSRKDAPVEIDTHLGRDHVRALATADDRRRCRVVKDCVKWRCDPADDVKLFTLITGRPLA